MMRVLPDVVASYFVLGAAGIGLYGQRLQRIEQHELWMKYLVYLFLVGAAIVLAHFSLFLAFAYVVAAGGFIETVEAGILHHASSGSFFAIASIVIYSLLCAGFLTFARMRSATILYVFTIVCVSDGLSQLCGQLFGRTFCFGALSPRKTLEGVAGGLIFAIVTGCVLCGVVSVSPWYGGIAGLHVFTLAFCGDLLGSACKRRYGLKDFSRILPWHGSLPDRYNSVIVGGGVIGLGAMLQGSLST